MPENQDPPKSFVLEWDKSPQGNFEIKITEYTDGDKALEHARTSPSEIHCVSTVNPLTGEGTEAE